MIRIDLFLLGVKVREQDDAASEIVLILLDFENYTLSGSDPLFIHSDIAHMLMGDVVGHPRSEEQVVLTLVARYRVKERLVVLEGLYGVSCGD